jgi:class 3 adenylate cyclase
MERPETRYVTVGDSEVAYQVVGDGPTDVLWIYPLGSHVDLFWQIPPYAQSVEQLSAFCRVIILDRRGLGASGPAPGGGVPNWEVFAEDIGAVLDASQATQTAIVSNRETGPIAMLYAGMHPERVSALVLLNTTARYLVDDDYPIGASTAAADAFVELMRTAWGTKEFPSVGIPSLTDDHEALRVAAMVQRASATPKEAAALLDYFFRHVDVRQMLSSIRVPTLVLHVQNNPILPIAHGRYLAEHIPGARFIELAGADMGGGIPASAIADIAEFLTGERPASTVDRVLATILLTDIVGSTERAASLGDRRWRGVLDAHDRAVLEQVRRFGGREIKNIGDGFLISFDGPARGIRCAMAISEAVTALGIEVRSGLHTGECELRGDDLGGLAVHIAARVNALAAPSEVLVTSTVKDLVVGSGIQFKGRGEHTLRGVPETWRLFSVVG